MKPAHFATALFACSVCSWGSAHAQVAYTNAALNGCYAHRGTSVDTGATTVGRDTIGTLCFDGKGNILGTNGSTGLSGHIANTDGTVHVVSNQTGTYNVTNSPGDGMGVFIGQCGPDHTFVLSNVDANGLAHGFSYIKTPTKKKSCNGNGPLVDGGGGEYQGPLK